MIKNDNSIKQELERRKRLANGRAPRLRKPVRQAEPRGLERDYQSKLRSFVERIREIIARRIEPQIELLVNIRDLRSNRDSERMDQTVAERLAALIRSTRIQVGRELPESEIRQAALQAGVSTAEFNRVQVGRVFTSALGINLAQDDSGLDEDIRNFAEENVTLIKNVSEEFMDETQRVISTGLRQGKRAGEISQDVLSRVRGEKPSRFLKAETRANLIARDQINKLNGKITETRQTNAGVESYIWRTALDERVRPAHASREGRTFKWSEPPSDGHPGEPINCRCFAEPVFDDLI